jgi:STE24 endopeptidase
MRPGALDRRGAWIMLVLASGVWLVLASWLVPWHWRPGLLDPVAADDFFTAPQLARAEAHSAAVRRLADASLVIGLAVVLGLGLTRWGRAGARRLVGGLPWWVAVPVAVLVLQLAVRAVRLPFAWQVRARRLEQGLTTQDAAGWWADQALAVLVSWVITSIGVLLVVACARRWPRRWYLPLGALVLTATYAVSMAYPVVVEPVFNEFTPLPAGELRQELVAIADEQGVDVGEVLVADASRRTTTLNAYVSGLGETKRLVLYDTLVADAPADEVVAVAAHEVAHAARRDVLVGTTLGAVALLVGVAGLALVADRRRWRVGPAHDPASTWSLLAVAAVVALAVSPLESAISRAVETRADADALAAHADVDSFRSLHVRLAQRSLADPTPPTWRQLWWGTHPTVLQRLALVAQEEKTDRG